MAKADRYATLLAKATANAASLKFDELETLALGYGYRHVRTKGSHAMYAHPEARLMNFQDDKGSAKVYQVKQLLSAIEEFNLKCE